MISRIQQPRLAITLVVTGALSFWLPDLAVHMAAGHNFDSLHVRIITFLLPATFLLAYVPARRFALNRDFKWAGTAMLLGVWLTAGLFLMRSFTIGGGGFARVGGVRDSLYLIATIVSSVIPIVTLMLATYEGSLFALLAVTIGPFLFWCVRASGLPLPFHRRLR